MPLIKRDGDNYVLSIPLSDAVAFALGWSDLGMHKPKRVLRQIVGHLAIDQLHYLEEWRAAAMLQACLGEREGP